TAISRSMALSGAGILADSALASAARCRHFSGANIVATSRRAPDVTLTGKQRPVDVVYGRDGCRAGSIAPRKGTGCVDNSDRMFLLCSNAVVGHRQSRRLTLLVCRNREGCPHPCLSGPAAPLAIGSILQKPLVLVHSGFRLPVAGHGVHRPIFSKSR